MKKLLLLGIVILTMMVFSNPANASPWATEKTYFGKTAGKFKYGLKNSLCGWMQMFKQAENPKYNTKWEGFCNGIAWGIIDTASGMIQLVTFPIPIDFPDVGSGL